MSVMFRTCDLYHTPGGFMAGECDHTPNIESTECIQENMLTEWKFGKTRNHSSSLGKQLHYSRKARKH